MGMRWPRANYSSPSRLEPRIELPEYSPLAQIMHKWANLALVSGVLASNIRLTINLLALELR